MSEKKLENKSKNMFANKGEAVDDSEVIKYLKIDPSLTNSAMINDAAFKSMYNQNVDGYIKQGYSEKDAKAMAHERMVIAKAGMNPKK